MDYFPNFGYAIIQIRRNKGQNQITILHYLEGGVCESSLIVSVR